MNGVRPHFTSDGVCGSELQVPASRALPHSLGALRVFAALREAIAPWLSLRRAYSANVASTASRISSGSAIRPVPVSPQAR